jgi:hypothetical protein
MLLSTGPQSSYRDLTPLSCIAWLLAYFFYDNRKSDCEQQFPFGSNTERL